MSDNNFQFYEFGEFKIDSRRRTLTKENQKISISSKNLDLLLFLVQNEGRILSHDEILEVVWEGTFVEQSNLKKGISAIRQVLGETPESSLFIKTIPRKGYSFVAPVRFSAEDSQIQQITATEIIIEEEIIEDDAPISEVKNLPLGASANLWAKYNKFILGSFAILILGGLAFAFRGYFFSQGKRFSAEKVKITKLTNDGNCADASISANGNFILCGVKTVEGNTLITRQISANSQVQLLPPNKNINFWAFKITPDGDYVYYMQNDSADSSRSGLYQIPFLGGSPRKINNSALHLTFSPDGKKIGFIRITETTNQIITANLDGSDEKIIAEYGDGSRVWGLNWSPGGQTLLCSLRQQIHEKFVGFVDEVSVADGSKKRIFENDRMVVSATWMPDKTSIILGMRELNSEVRQIWQYFPQSKELIRVTNDNSTYRFPVLNQAGTIISVSQESTPSDIFLGESGSGKLQKLTNSTVSFSEISRTKTDGFIYSSFEGGTEAIWVMNADGSNQQQISDGKDGINLNPKLSSDGNSIVYASMRSGTKELWRINLDGSGLTKITKNIEELMWQGKLLADNQTLIVNSTYKSFSNLWKQNPNGEKVLLAEKIGAGWDVSPDDKLLIYNTYNDSAKQQEIVIKSLETKQILQTFPVSVVDILKWIDSNSFFYETKTGDKFQIFKQTLDNKPPTLIYEYLALTNERIPGFDFLADGKRFLLLQGKYLTDAVTIKIDESKISSN